MAMPVSKSAARRAGSMIRKFMRDECTFEELEPFIEIVDKYRASFTPAMEAVHYSLLEVHRTSGIAGEVTRRLKKSGTIFGKLVREAGIDLSRMHDIGGCRSVVASLDDLYEVQRLVTAQWETKTIDYISTPRDSGYRAIHLIVKPEDHPIEIQLRTSTMHQWAQMVEGFSMMLSTNYKQDGDEIVQQYMRALSKIMSATEAGVPPDSDSLATVGRLRPEVATLIDQVQDTPDKGNTL